LGEDRYVSESAQGHRLADFFDGVLGGTGVDVGGHDVGDGYGKQSRTMASEPTDHITFGNDAEERVLAGHDGRSEEHTTELPSRLLPYTTLFRSLGEDWYVSESAQGRRLADFFDGVLGGTGVDVGGHDVGDGYGKQSRTMASEPTDHITFGNDAEERVLAGHDGGTDVVPGAVGEQVGDGRFR